MNIVYCLVARANQRGEIGHDRISPLGFCSSEAGRFAEAARSYERGFELMREFYANLKSMAKSEALRQFAHPFYWTAYQLTGES